MHTDQRKPLVVAIVDGGLVQDEVLGMGCGIPELHVLDFDRDDADHDDNVGFLDYVRDVREQLQKYKLDIPDYWIDKAERLAQYEDYDDGED